jgi:gluconolactonase
VPAGRARSSATAADGAPETLVDRFEGRRLNSPNDLVLDRSGAIWFTDPRYGGNHADRELDHDSVYRIAPPATGEGPWEIRRLTFDTTRPNGLLLSWDESILYVAQSDYAPGSVRQLRAYPVEAGGALGPYTVLHDFGEARGIDGMCWDAEGAIVATCGWEASGPWPADRGLRPGWHDPGGASPARGRPNQLRLRRPRPRRPLRHDPRRAPLPGGQHGLAGPPPAAHPVA